MNGTMYVTRWSSADLNDVSIFITPREGYSATGKLVVLDWITVNFYSPDGGNQELQLLDSGAIENGSGGSFTSVSDPGVLLCVAINVPPGENDTVHLPFPGGYPLRQIQDAGGWNTPFLTNPGDPYQQSNLNGDRPVGIGAIQFFANDGSTGTNVVKCWIGWHFERNNR